MSSYQIADPFIGAPMAATQTDTVQRFPLGLEARGIDVGSGTAQAGGGVFRYCQGSNLTAAGYFVHIVGNSAVLLASGNSASKWPIGVAAGNLSATNVYGWVQVQGLCDFARGTNTAPSSNIPVHMCATDGILLTNVNNNRVHGVVGAPGQTNTAVSSAGLYQYYLERPTALGPMSATNAGGY